MINKQAVTSLHMAEHLKCKVNFVPDNILFFFYIFFIENKFNQTIHMKCQDLFLMKNDKKKNVVCYICDWLFKG